MRYLLRFVKVFLKDAGEFYPIGAVMRTTGEMKSIGAYDGRENPPSEDVIAMIRPAFMEGAKNGSFRATALACDVLFTDSETGAKSDAITIQLDHRQNYSVVVCFRYRLDHGELVLEAPTASPGAQDIFV